MSRSVLSVEKPDRSIATQMRVEVPDAGPIKL